ncbi:extracellular solute-binding protein [Amphibiibacter pelophylacis]|uniref:Extracellular solute-binding protein n=1 Tax=Amphibiibacter pelophylacis TaxID=1799477 RepID=A0ACC6P599_9BURK
MLRLKHTPLAAALLLSSLSLSAHAETLRLLTWADYAPRAVIEQFKKETGIDVEVTLSNNEEMISKLRATGGAGFDLANPSQDRITGPVQQFRIYQPIDLSKVKTAQFTPSMLKATQAVTGLNGKVYGLPLFWGTDGLVVNSKLAPAIKDYGDLCDARYTGKTAVRLVRPSLIAQAFAMGKDPFKAYANPKEYEAIMTAAGDKLAACKPVLKYFWENKDQLLSDVRSGAVVGAQMWDAGAWKLNAESPDIRFVAPASGALGWVDTFAIPAKAKNVDAAYKWINFVTQPQIAAQLAQSAGSFTAVKDAEKYMPEKMKAQLAESFPPAAMDNIKWYPAIPAGLEAIDGRVLDRIKAAR